jgi:predicted nucleic acid-binding protein
MRYVLDASVGLKWVLPEHGSDKAIAIGLDYRSGFHDLIAPDTFPPEVAHALTRAERRGILTAQEGAAHFAALLSGLPEIHASLPLLPRAYELSSQFRLGVFDCVYVSLAEREQCQLITADQRIVALFPALAVALDTLP